MTANIISRARGQRVVAAAAYRAGAALRDERYGITHNYAAKSTTVHSEIMAPPGAPQWVRNREVLWNTVEAGERRKDAQLARLIEVALPIELSAHECVGLAREYIATEFVSQGMIADFFIRARAANPHAHILLTLRPVTQTGFGPKERRWNGKAVLLEWRSAWATRANEHLARAGHAVRIDHRTLEAQHIELAPERRIGIGRARRDTAPLPDHLTERMAEQQRIAGENGQAILDDPTVALRAITHQRPAFTHRDLEHFLRSRTESETQFEAALRAILRSPELVALDRPGNEGLMTSRDMLEAEKSILRRAASMALRRGHLIEAARQSAVLSRFTLDDAQRRAFEYLVSEGDAKALAVPRSVKAVLLAAACEAWKTQGLSVKAVAAERIAECEAEWQRGSGLTRETVLVLDGAHALALKQVERVLAVADNGRAKVVLVADSDQLRAMRVAPPFLKVSTSIGLEVQWATGQDRRE